MHEYGASWTAVRPCACLENSRKAGRQRWTTHRIQHLGVLSPHFFFLSFFWGGCLFVVLHCALLHQCYLYPPSCPPQQECHKVTFTAKVPMWGRGTYFVFSEFSILILLCVGEAWLLCMNFLLINKFFFLKLVLQIFLPIFKLKT